MWWRNRGNLSFLQTSTFKRNCGSYFWHSERFHNFQRHQLVKVHWTQHRWCLCYDGANSGRGSAAHSRTLLHSPRGISSKRMPMDLRPFWTMLSEWWITSKVVHCKHVCFPFCVNRWVVNTASFYCIQRSAGSHAAECSPGSSNYVTRSEPF